MKAFHALIKAITEPPVLAIADDRFSLDTDACDGQIGCALFQEHEGKRRPVGYFSRTLTKPERNYSISEKECLAIIWAVMTLRPYLLGVEFDLNTDHSSLRWLMNITDPSDGLLRWRLRLSEFDFAINYKKGSRNLQADAMSRLSTLGETTVEPDYEIPSYTVESSDTDKDEEVEFLENSFGLFYSWYQQC